jgi:hypothetical protein
MLMPTNICSPDAHVEFMPFVLLAGRLQQTINAGLAARYDMREITSYCLSLREEFNSGNVHRDTLYALQPALALRFRAAAQTRTVCTAVDGYHVCTSADDYLAWQEAWDIVLLSLPPVDDFLRFYNALEDDYRNRLKRAPHVVHNTTDDRVTTIVRYLGYRLDECSHDEAATKTIRQVLGERVLRICKNVVERKQALPPANETFEFLQRLESLNASRSPSRLVSSYVDLEGEAVWLQEYLRQRLSGRDHTESTEVVLRAVRQVAPTPQ